MAEDRRGGATIDSWCGRTNTHDGHDGGAVAHAARQPGRGCYDDPRAEPDPGAAS